MTNPAQRAQSAFPAGSNGEFNLPPELSIVIARGEGCRLWDSGGREFLDFSMGWGSVLVGHARPEVAAAVTTQAVQGANFAYVTEASLTLRRPSCRSRPFPFSSSLSYVSITLRSRYVMFSTGPSPAIAPN